MSDFDPAAYLRRRGLESLALIVPDTLKALYKKSPALAEALGPSACHPRLGAIVALLPYDPRPVPPPDSSSLSIGAFASANRYAVLRRILMDAAKTVCLASNLPKSSCRVAVNSRLPEKFLAIHAGLGFIGRSSLLVSKDYGPACVIGILFAPFPEGYSGVDPLSSPPGDDRLVPGAGCGTCMACVSACPSGALGATGFRGERCLQYWMSRPDFPDELLPARGNRLYGCDECTASCPHSRGAWDAPGGRNPSQLAEALFEPKETGPGSFVPSGSLKHLDPAAVREFFRGTALGMTWLPHEAFLAFARRLRSRD